jgi:hypothetical protein
MNSETLTSAEIELLARRAGLDRALADFPGDVLAAAQLAASVVTKLQSCNADASVEPWPPMIVPADE